MHRSDNISGLSDRSGEDGDVLSRFRLSEEKRSPTHSSDPEHILTLPTLGKIYRSIALFLLTNISIDCYNRLSKTNSGIDNMKSLEFDIESQTMF